MHPFFNWVGSKRRYVKRLAAYCPKDFDCRKNTYFEPFLGSGSMLFFLQPDKAVIGDVDPVIVQAFKVVKSHSASVKDLLLKIYRRDPEAIFKVLCKQFCSLSPIEQTAALIYITKHSYGSLFRFDADRHRITSTYRKEIRGMNWSNYYKVTKFLQEKQIRVICKDFACTLQHAKAGDFIFLDPPYIISPNSKLYFQNQLAVDALCNTMSDLHKRGCLILLICNANVVFDERLKAFHRYPFRAKEAFVNDKIRQESIYINYRL